MTILVSNNIQHIILIGCKNLQKSNHKVHLGASDCIAQSSFEALCVSATNVIAFISWFVMGVVVSIDKINKTCKLPFLGGPSKCMGNGDSLSYNLVMQDHKSFRSLNNVCLM